MSKKQTQIGIPYMYHVEIAKDKMIREFELFRYNAAFNGYIVRNPDMFKSRSFALIKAQLLANDYLNLEGKTYPIQVFLERDWDDITGLLIHDSRGLTDEIRRNIQGERSLLHDYYKNEDDWMVQMDFQNNLKNAVEFAKKVHKINHDLFKLPKFKHRYFSFKNEKNIKKYYDLTDNSYEGIFMFFKENEYIGKHQ